MKINLQELPRFGDKLSFLYLEHAVIEQEDQGLAAWQEDGITSIPVAGLAVLLLGPGTKISHAAIHTLADNGCLVGWCGEDSVRFYASGVTAHRSARNLLTQCRLVTSEITRLQVVVRMYTMRFDEPVDPGLTLQQLRGKEGIRVREAYAQAARTWGVNWQGRDYQRQNWDYSDPVNRALSAANACLYGVVHAAILAGGYSTALGFIHQGKHLSFVYDIADLYKLELVVPLAFELAKANPEHLERVVRQEARRRFGAAKLMERILPDIARAFDVALASEDSLVDEYAGDESRPAQWWDPRRGDQIPIGQLLTMNPDPSA
jgi:CRISPR-associated protein Cas1